MTVDSRWLKLWLKLFNPSVLTASLADVIVQEGLLYSIVAATQIRFDTIHAPPVARVLGALTLDPSLRSINHTNGRQCVYTITYKKEKGRIFHVVLRLAIKPDMRPAGRA